VSTETDHSISDTKGKPEKPDKNLQVKVWAPRHPKPKNFIFKADTLVGAAAAEVASKFEYAAGNHTFQNEAEDLLDRDKTLAEQGVKDGAELQLVDVGGGV
jgi:hypothetical protein